MAPAVEALSAPLPPERRGRVLPAEQIPLSRQAQYHGIKCDTLDHCAELKALPCHVAASANVDRALSWVVRVHHHLELQCREGSLWRCGHQATGMTKRGRR
jgi:hypothetical protein